MVRIYIIILEDDERDDELSAAIILHIFSNIGFNRSPRLASSPRCSRRAALSLERYGNMSNRSDMSWMGWAEPHKLTRLCHGQY